MPIDTAHAVLHDVHANELHVSGDHAQVYILEVKHQSLIDGQNLVVEYLNVPTGGIIRTLFFFQPFSFLTCSQCGHKKQECLPR